MAYTTPATTKGDRNGRVILKNCCLTSGDGEGEGRNPEQRVTWIVV
ncbi:MAG: hypothetical protein J2P54_03155 [Bradyrhizobiaceae bacterium]|nr:hypothetical protein [Bradyrhizobiaceae bacterium]